MLPSPSGTGNWSDIPFATDPVNLNQTIPNPLSNAMAYQLSVSIFGPGISEPAHWGFVIHQPPNDSGELLHVRVIDVPMNIFQFEPRVPHLLDSQGAYGLCKIADLDGAQRFKVASILEREVPAPRGGMKNCQDWVLDGLVALEVEELVADGTTAIE